MRLFQITTLSYILFLLTNCSPNETNNESPQEQELLETIEIFNEAFKNGDVGKLSSMITNNYQHTNGNSKSIGKEKWLAYLTTRTADIESGALKVLYYKMEEIATTFHGFTAIVTAKITVINERGEDTRENEYRVTNIWVLENGNWKRAAFHDGKIK